MKYYADDLNVEENSCCKTRVDEDKSFFSSNAELFYNGVRQGYFPSFFDFTDKKDGQVFVRPLAVRYEDGQLIKGMNQLVLQQQASILELSPSINGSIYLSADERNLTDSRYHVRFSTAGAFGKLYNYKLAPVRKNCIENNNIGQKINFIIPDDFDASVYLGKWIAATKVGGTFITSEEKNRRAQKLILMELLKGKEEDLSVNAYNLGRDAENESNRILNQVVDKVKSSGMAGSQNIRYDEKEACIAMG